MLRIFSNFTTEADMRKRLDPLYFDKPITIFNDRVAKTDELSLNPINILILHEPDELFGLHHYAYQNHRDFTAILTWNKDLVNSVDNAFLTLTGFGIMEKDFVKEMNTKKKKFEITFLSGHLEMISGHKLRKSVFTRRDEILIPKKVWKVLSDFDHNKMQRPHHPQEGKKICFEESMFHISIENCKHDNWFTAKVIDAFRTKTVPIYWGANNLDQHFKKEGFIRFSSIDELFRKVNNLTEETYYNMKPYIDTNYEIAKNYIDYYREVIKFIDYIIEENDL